MLATDSDMTVTRVAVTTEVFAADASLWKVKESHEKRQRKHLLQQSLNCSIRTRTVHFFSS